MKQHKDGEQPWLLSVNCFNPHPPYDAPQSLVEKYLNGRSLLPALKADVPLKPRKFVRSEYYDTLEFDPHYDGLRTDAEISTFDNELPTSYADMFFDGRYKLNVYHGSYFGELFDLKEDPKEQHNLWADPAYQGLKSKLLLDSYEAAVKYSRPGQERRGRF